MQSIQKEIFFLKKNHILRFILKVLSKDSLLIRKFNKKNYENQMISKYIFCRNRTKIYGFEFLHTNTKQIKMME
jgi:hypothetical protein